MQSIRSGIVTPSLASREAREDNTSASWGEALIPAPFGRRQPLPVLDDGSGSAGEQTVWVRAAVTCDTQARPALQVEEWALETVMGSNDVVLSFLRPDGAAQSLLLKAVDAQDLAVALQRVGPPAEQAFN